MSQVERQELSSAPEEDPRLELRFFPFYSEAGEKFRRGQETLKRAGEDPEILGAAVLRLHGAAEKITEEFLNIFEPIHSLYSGSFRANLQVLHYRLNLINKADCDIFLSRMEDRIEFAHGGEFSLSREEIENYAKLVRDLILNINSKSCELWEELVTCTDLGGPFASREIRKNIRKLLIEDIVEQRDEWIDWSFGSKVKWEIFYNITDPDCFYPASPLTETDFVVSLLPIPEDPTPENPGKIDLFARLLTGEDLNEINPETFKDFLNHDFPVVIFIPEKHREGFLEKLSPISEHILFTGYHYDKNAKLHLTLEDRT